MKYDRFINDKNKDLISFVKTKYHVRVKKSNRDSWTSEIKGKQVIIGALECNHPYAAFAHELLHVKYQIMGYKKLKFGISEFDKTDYFKTLMEALDNELQHHIMYDEFIKLGFKPEEFYHDNDYKNKSSIEIYLNGNEHDLKSSLLMFLTIIAPGGCFSNKEQSDFLNKLKDLEKGIHKQLFQDSEQLFHTWSKSTDYDYKEILTNLFLKLPNGNITWLGHGDKSEFPENGFFIEKEFVMKPTEK